jgi:acetyl/propionyl-CoA carboxylase alpha subunit
MTNNKNKILIANRGEIAIRIITAASELGIQTVAVYSDDQDKSHCFGANESIKLKSAASFLDPRQIIHAAQRYILYICFQN